MENETNKLNAKSRFFNLLVIGDNPEELIKKYDKRNTVEKYIKFKYKDAEKLRKSAIKALKGLLDNIDKLSLQEFTIDTLKDKLKSIENMSNFEYYQTLTNGLYYDENGNALSEENPDGKFDDYTNKLHLAIPLRRLDGTDVTSDLKKNIDWEHMHRRKDSVDTYTSAWEVCVDKREPETEDEVTISKMMEDKGRYFENFASKEEYVNYSTSFWEYAIINEGGWQSIDGNDSKIWVNDFYDKFIKPLDGNTKLTIYECSVK